MRVFVQSILLLVIASAQAQVVPEQVSSATGPASALSIDVRLVGLSALVRDKKGELGYRAASINKTKPRERKK